MFIRFLSHLALKHFLSLADVPHLSALVDEAMMQKKKPFADAHLGVNKTLGLLFFNASLRTRLSTQRAAQNLGLHTVVMNVGADSWGLEMHDGTVMDGSNAEHIREAAPVIAQYCDIIGIRSFAQLHDREADYQETVLTKFKDLAGVPILNLESATRHPLQSLADVLTIEETRLDRQLRRRPKVVLTWLPHFKALPQAVPNSFCEWINAMDYDFVITHPEGYDLPPDVVGRARVTHDQDEALRGADYVYGKNWSSYQHYGQVLSQDAGWMLTMDKMRLTNEGKFMHCLPLRRNLKVTDEVLNGPQSIVVQQAGNRTWAAQAVLKHLLLELR